MKHQIFFPLYNIYSDLVKTAIGLKDSRSIDQFFQSAGIRIYNIGKKKCVTCEDLLNIFKPKQIVIPYQAKSDLSRKIDSLE